MRFMALVGVAALASTPAFSTVYRFDWTGTVTDLRLNTAATGVRIGDAATASFLFDDASAAVISTAWGPSLTTYSGTLTNYSFAVGSLSLAVPTLSTQFFTESNWYGQSGFVFDPHFDSPAFDLEHMALGQAAGAGSPLANGFALAGLPDQRMTLFVGTGAAREGIFATMRATVSVLSAVPEPASWAMMIGGFGLVGAVLRHRRRADEALNLR